MSYELHFIVHTFQGIVELILSTDMSRNSDILNGFRKALEQGVDYENTQHRSLVSSTQISYIYVLVVAKLTTYFLAAAQEDAYQVL